jgi:FAD/FMN-containing dehydrogenase
MNIESLKKSIRGRVIASEDSGYEAARKALIWNGRKPPRFPRLIVKAACADDVQQVVRFAAEHGQRVSPRGGGHHWSGISLQEGIALDLSALNHVRIDAGARTAEVGPTVRNGELASALAAHGLAFPVGHCATVPLSGYLLGGGFGWNSGAWGMACFSVIGADVVTADGELRGVSATENPDIFWALRGAGPEFFGVVTAYRLRLQPLPRAITTSAWTYAIGDVTNVERWAKETMVSAPRNVEFTLSISSPPPPLADKAPKVVSGVTTVFADTEEEARTTLGRIAAAAPAGALDIQQNLATPFEVLYQIIGQFFPEGRRYLADTFWAKSNADGFARRIAVETAKAPSLESFSLAVPMPPAFYKEPLPDAAFSMVGSMFGCSYAIWRDAADDAANMGWIRRTARALLPVTSGQYLGEADLDEPARLRGSFSPANWTKLKALQAKYDPTGMFRTQQSFAASLEVAA